MTYSSLTKAETMMGCDRGLFLGLATISSLLILPAGLVGGRWGNVLLGIGVMLGGYRLLVALGKYDPRARDVWGRSREYRDFYPAVNAQGTGRRPVRRWR